MSWHRAPSLLLAQPAQLTPFLHHPRATGMTLARADGGEAHPGTPEFSSLVAKVEGQTQSMQAEVVFIHAIRDEGGKIITR